MQIDLFTLVAEIVNFLILIWLLQRFLYKPIINVMEAREQKIADQLNDAEQKRLEAEREAVEYHMLKQDLEDERDERLQQAREEAQEQRQSLMEQAREETEELRRNWQRAIRQEKVSFLNGVEQKVGRSAVEIARRALSKMADERLEAQVVQVFIQRLQDTSDETHDAICDTLHDERIRIETTFELSNEDRDTLESALRDFADSHVSPSYIVLPEMLCGIRLTTGDHEISWSFEDYTQAIHKQFETMIDESTERQTRRESEERDTHEEKRHAEAG